MRGKLSRLEAFVNQLRDGQSSQSDVSHLTARVDEARGTRGDQTESNLVPLTGKLNLSENATRYVGGAHWEAIIDDVSLVANMTCSYEG